MRFATLLNVCYRAARTEEPIERFYSSMFAAYYDQIDTQPTNGTVNAILRGRSLPSRRLVIYYHDPSHPRCPDKLLGDWEALLDSCFVSVCHRRTLRQALKDYLNAIPKQEYDDLRDILGEDLAHNATILTWYAICGDYDDQASQ